MLLACLSALIFFSILGSICGCDGRVLIAYEVTFWPPFFMQIDYVHLIGSFQAGLLGLG
jgi:hypothetical protein